ncbi:MAG: 50S ribosomal protein L2 [Candidatus Gracilibacteria bacterium]
MALKKYRPTTPSRRQMTGYSFDEITTSTPYKPLTTRIKTHAGRNNTGTITVRHQGAGHKKRYRLVDFAFTGKLNVPAKVETIEYDPYRTGYIALVCYYDGERRYVLAHKDMKVGDVIITAETAKPVAGNRMKIGNIPVGLAIYNLELIVGQGASSVRSAGSSAMVSSQEGEYTQVKMPSGEIRKIHKNCYATIGVVSNTDHNQIVIGKAGRSRWMGIRPTVLGSSMNAVDHPHGGGEGHQSLGQRKGPKTPWGKLARGVKTRRRKDTNRWIVRTRAGKLLNP